MEETYIYARLRPDPTLESLIAKIRAGDDVREKMLPPEVAGFQVGGQNGQVVRRSAIHSASQGTLADKVQPAGPTAPTPSGQVTTGEQQVGMRDLGDPVGKELPQLPPDPAAYVRFKHVQ